jgi:hypothetical protein
MGLPRNRKEKVLTHETQLCPAMYELDMAQVAEVSGGLWCEVGDVFGGVAIGGTLGAIGGIFIGMGIFSGPAAGLGFAVGGSLGAIGGAAYHLIEH